MMMTMMMVECCLLHEFATHYIAHVRIPVNCIFILCTMDLKCHRSLSVDFVLIVRYFLFHFWSFTLSICLYKTSVLNVIDLTRILHQQSNDTARSLVSNYDN